MKRYVESMLYLRLLVSATLVIILVGCNSNVSDDLVCPGQIIGDVSLTPDINITTANQTGNLAVSGVADNLDAREHRVVLWAKTDQWYIQPFINAPYTSVCSNGSWSTTSHQWNRLTALLVDQSYIVTATSQEHPSNATGVLAWDEVPHTSPDRLVAFSGRDWRVKSALEGQVGPGPNYFSDLDSDIWIDEQGLHLTTTNRGGKWFSTEIVLLESLGYGSYTFQLSSRTDNLDEQAIFAGFVYESLTREIDIEFSKLLSAPNNAQYVVQPWTTPGNLIRFDSSTLTETSHRFIWSESTIQFISWNGHEQDPTDTGSIIQEWTYTGTDIPPVGGERMRFNLWLFDGLAPVSGSADEVVVKSFTFSGSANSQSPGIQ